MATDIVRSRSSLAVLRDEWDELATLFERPLLRHDWFACAARAFHEDGDLRVVLVRRGGRLVAVAPLACVHLSARDRLELIGGSALYEPGGLLYADEEALLELLEEIDQLRLPLFLNRIEADSPIPRMVGRQLAARALVFRRNSCPSLAVEVQGEWTDYAQGLSRELKRNLKRKRRRAAELGAMSIESLTPGLHDFDGLFNRVMDVEASGWKGRRGSAMLRRARVAQFFRTYCSLAAARGELRISLLYFGPHMAAVAVAQEAYRRMWQFKIGYEERLGKYSPGQLLTFDTIARAFSQGLAALEFLGCAEPWKRRWNPVPRSHAAVIAYPFSASGLWGLSADTASRAMNRLRAAPWRGWLGRASGET